MSVQALLVSPMLLCHCALPGRRHGLKVKGGCIQGLWNTQVAVVDTPVCCQEWRILVEDETGEAGRDQLGRPCGPHLRACP